MSLPNFIIAGAQKSGTTTLYDVLKLHPKIHMSCEKEVCFFNKPENYSRGAEWYESFFTGAGNGQLLGESTPDYLWDVESAQRMSEVVPGVKLIFMLRNPVDRAYSSYWHAVRYGRESKSFEEAINIEKQKIMRSETEWRYNAYVSRGDYVTQLKRFYSLFQKENILVKTFEQYKNSPKKEIVEILEFLGLFPTDEIMEAAVSKRSNIAFVPRFFYLQKARPLLGMINPSLERALDRINLEKKKYPSMDESTRKRLKKHFTPMKVELEKILDRKLVEWI